MMWEIIVKFYKRAERLGDEKEGTAREDSHGVLC